MMLQKRMERTDGENEPARNETAGIWYIISFGGGVFYGAEL